MPGAVPGAMTGRLVGSVAGRTWEVRLGATALPSPSDSVLFPVPAATNQHKVGGLTRQKFILSSESQKSEIKCWQGRTVSRVSRGGPLFASPSFRWLLALVGLWLRHSNLCLCGPTCSSSLSHWPLSLNFGLTG